jgi:malic enzyme
MESLRRRTGPDGKDRVLVPYRGTALLNHPLYNKSTAFTREERGAFGLEGLLPDVVSSMEQQARRAYGNIVAKESPLERYIGLAALHDRNEHLYFRVLQEHLEEFLPVVYTPTVGLACQQYSRIFRRPRGLWITPDHRGRVAEALGNAPFEDVRLIVVTDNERILGLGDQGAGGMGIPLGKLSLYTATAGIPPWQTLPVSLDVGTDNPDLLGDDLYIGWRHPRLRGPDYEQVVDEFVGAVKARFPRALLQWEDFKQANAFKLLDRYRRELPSFNDDIQGTSAVAVAGLKAGARAAGRPFAQERVLIVGAGAAGVGIARLIRGALQRAGVGGEELRRSVALLDVDGLLVDAPEDYRRDLAWPAALARAHGLLPGADLLSTVRALRPTALIGVSGAAGAFSEDVVRALAAQVERPLVLPLSNPTSQSEARPADVIAWTDGRALVATGSPFDAVSHGGRTHRIGQGNNVFVFPGLGLGVLVSEAREVTDPMFAAAAETLAAQVRDEHLREGSLFPPVGDLRQVAARVAEAVVREARDSGLGRPFRDAEIAPAVAAAMWEPAYPPLEPV